MTHHVRRLHPRQRSEVGHDPPYTAEQCLPVWETPPKTLLTEQWPTAAPIAVVRAHTHRQSVPPSEVDPTCLKRRENVGWEVSGRDGRRIVRGSRGQVAHIVLKKL